MGLRVEDDASLVDGPVVRVAFLRSDPALT
jgi:hypothetical protein